MALTSTSRPTPAEPAPALPPGPAREAVRWLADQLRWEATLDRLRSIEGGATQRAA